MTEADKEYAKKIPHLPFITVDPRLNELAKNHKPSAKLARAIEVMSKIKWMDGHTNEYLNTENTSAYIVNEEEVEYVVQKKDKPE